MIGNPFLLQWNEYLAWHGRLVSHILLRIILQLPGPVEELVFSGVILWVIITCYRAVNPQFIRNSGKHDFPLFILLFCLLFVFIPVSSTAYVMVTFFMSNIFAIGLIFFFLGMLVILLSPGSPTRIEKGYGNAQQWQFLGQTLNWVELGPIRYAYSLFHHLFLAHGAYIPNTLPYFIIIGILLYFVLKKVSLWNGRLFRIFVFIAASLGMTVIMMFSPLYYEANLLFGMVFLFIALMMLIKLFWELYPDNKIIPLAIKSVILAAFIIFGIQCFAWNHYRKEYNHVVELINEAKASQKTEVKVLAFTQFAIKTPLGNIYPVYLQRTSIFYTRMAEYCITLGFYAAVFIDHNKFIPIIDSLPKRDRKKRGCECWIVTQMRVRAVSYWKRTLIQQ